jgi:hypothetical protein
MINEETDISIREINAKAQNKKQKTEDKDKFWKGTIEYHVVSVLEGYTNAGEDTTIVAYEEASECAKDLGLFSVMYGRDEREEGHLRTQHVSSAVGNGATRATRYYVAWDEHISAGNNSPAGR